MAISQGDKNSFLVHVGHAATAMGVETDEVLLALRQLAEKKVEQAANAYRNGAVDSAINDAAVPNHSSTSDRLEYMGLFD